MKVFLQRGVVVDGVEHREVEIRGLTMRQSMRVKRAAAELPPAAEGEPSFDGNEATGLVRTAWRSWVPSLDRHLEAHEVLDLLEVDFGVLMDACREVSKREATFRASAAPSSHGAGPGREDDRVE